MFDQLAPLAVLMIFSVNAVLLASLVVLKALHRRRVRNHNERRQTYLKLLSRYVSLDDCDDPITEAMAEDQAFLDALLDMRNAITGDEVAVIRRIVNHHGIIERQAKRLRSRFPLGRRLRAS